jgi:hypothetical protein
LSHETSGTSGDRHSAESRLTARWVSGVRTLPAGSPLPNASPACFFNPLHISSPPLRNSLATSSVRFYLMSRAGKFQPPWGELGISRTTVRRQLRAAEFPERAPRRRRSKLDSFRPYLENRRSEGCHNTSQLCRELHHRGYGGPRSRVKEYVRTWRVNVSPAVWTAGA